MYLIHLYNTGLCCIAPPGVITRFVEKGPMRKQGPFSFAAAHATLYIQGFCCQFYYLQVVPPLAYWN